MEGWSELVAWTQLQVAWSKENSPKNLNNIQSYNAQTIQDTWHMKNQKEKKSQLS
jgi:hypothetical protein